ncbi:tetratricopeptide repeat protein [Kitasatospora sp. NPDC006697]|uniref:tetratricopeptide repeat protein n=1 Tax=Kitasatospora sp. NPDC006697 TaxID=3364020 RepID=UPI003687DAFF
MLAGTVTEQWRAEAAARALDDPDPMPVRWRLAVGGEVMDHPANVFDGPRLPTGSSDRIADVAAGFRHLRRRRLVIVGGPGAGKTTLAVQLLLELLAGRKLPGNREEPVPVLLSVADWDTARFPRMHEWLAWRLGQDYPGMRAPGLGVDVPRALAARSEILPVLDGLDELPRQARVSVVAALNRSLSAADQLILTSRTAEYAEAVADVGDVLTSAAVIEAEPLGPEAVAAYLHTCLPPQPGPVWEAVLSGLRGPHSAASPAGILATTCSLPLGLWLVRATYLVTRTDPTPLLEGRFPTPAALRAHLFDQLIPAAIASKPPTSNAGEPFRPRRHHEAERMRRQLGYLAWHLTNPRNSDGTARTRDFAWWRLAHDTFRRDAPTIFARATTPFVFGLSFAVAPGLGWGACAALAFTVTTAVSGLVGAGFSAAAWHAFAQSAWGWLWFGALVVVLCGVTAGVQGGTWLDETPGQANFRAPGLRLLTRGLLWRMTKVASMTGVLIGISFDAQQTGGWAVGLRAGLLGTLAAALLVGVVAWAETPNEDGRAQTPATSWRVDRRLNVIRVLVAAAVTGIVADVMLGLLGLGLGVVADFAIGAVLGAGVGLASGRHHASLAFQVVTNTLTLRGRMPRGLTAFLDDAYRLGLLRRVGPIYQFRHAELQDHLARSHDPRQTPRTERRERRERPKLTVRGRLGARRPVVRARQILVKRVRSLGEEHPATTTARAALAQAHRAAGEPGPAVDLLAENLAIALRRLGTDHPDLMGHRNALVDAYLDQDEPARAVPLLEQVLADSERIHGINHPETLAVRHSLAYVHAQAGNPGQAIAGYEAALSGKILVLGDQHPATTLTRNNLAAMHARAGDRARAVTLHEQNLAVRVRTLGPDHPDTLMTRESLAHSYQAAGEPAKAVALYEQMVAGEEQSVGENHAAALRARLRLAVSHRLAGDLDRSTALLTVLLADAERVLAASDELVMEIRDVLADAHDEAGTPERAAALFERNHAERMAVHGAGHPASFVTRHKLARSYELSGDRPRALRLRVENVAASQRALGHDHPHVFVYRRSLAIAHQEAGEPAEAVRMYEVLLPDTERAFGPDHPDTQSLRRDLGWLYLETGQAERAVPLFRQALNTCVRLGDEDPVEMLTCRHDLASACSRVGELDQAAILLRDNIVLARQVGELHRLRCYQNMLAAVRQGAGEPQEVVSLLEQALAGPEPSPDQDEDLFSRSLLAWAYRELGDVAKAVRLHADSLREARDLLGPDHWVTLHLQVGLAEDHAVAGEPERGVPMLEQAVAHCLRVLGERDRVTIIAQRALAEAYQTLADPRGRPLLEQLLVRSVQALGARDPLTERIRSALQESG